MCAYLWMDSTHYLRHLTPEGRGGRGEALRLYPIAYGLQDEHWMSLFRNQSTLCNDIQSFSIQSSSSHLSIIPSQEFRSLRVPRVLHSTWMPILPCLPESASWFHPGIPWDSDQEGSRNIACRRPQRTYGFVQSWYLTPIANITTPLQNCRLKGTSII